MVQERRAGYLGDSQKDLNMHSVFHIPGILVHFVKCEQIVPFLKGHISY